MMDCSTVLDTLADDPDPRVDDGFVRCVPGDDTRGSVLLVGVVHDHPASVFRVAHVFESVAADVVALELPPLAMPLFRAYARDGRHPPRFGGEMSATIQAAEGVRTVGIDAPSATYFDALVDRFVRDPPDAKTAKSAARDLLSALGQAITCRLVAPIAKHTPFTPRVYTDLEYDVSLLDTASEQADHETAHLARRRALFDAIEAPTETALIDELRELAMIDRLRDLRAGGSDVIAVIGMEHLDPVASGLSVSG
jgi:hypothetical protein